MGWVARRWLRQRVLGELRALGLPVTGEAGVLVSWVADFLDRELLVFVDPTYRRARMVGVREVTERVSALCIPPHVSRDRAVCRALGRALFPGNLQAARMAGELLIAHLVQSRDALHLLGMSPVEAQAEKALRLTTTLVPRPVLQARPPLWRHRHNP